MQHRMHLAPLHDGVRADAGQRHWRERHGAVVRRLPDLRGYVQNRPLEAWWGRLALPFCAESWFASRDAEAAAFTGDCYRTTVIPDEERFIDRRAAWSAPVTGSDVLREAPRERLRVLAFGGSSRVAAAAGTPGRVEVLHLGKAPPGVDEPHVVSAWTDDDVVADRLARELGGMAFVAMPAAVVAPDAGWPGAGEVAS